METLVVGAAALYAWLNSSKPAGDPRTKPGDTAGGALQSVVVPPGPSEPSSVTGTQFSTRDGAAIANAIGKGGKALAGAATGFAVGLGVGELVQEGDLLNSKNVAPYTTEAIPWGFGAAGAGVGVAVAVGAVSISVSTVAFVAFPIAVAVFAIFDVAKNIETSIRREKERQRYAEILALFDARQYRRAFELAVQSVEQEEMPWLMPRKVRDIRAQLTEYELGDSPTVAIASEKPAPDAAAETTALEGQTIKATGNVVNVVEVLAAAYAPAREAFARDRQLMWGAWSRSERAQLAWIDANRTALDAGDAIAARLAPAQPWWAPGALRWRPPFPVARDVATVTGLSETGVAVIDQQLAAAEAGTGIQASTTTTDTGETSTAGRWGESSYVRGTGGGAA